LSEKMSVKPFEKMSEKVAFETFTKLSLLYELKLLLRIEKY